MHVEDGTDFNHLSVDTTEEFFDKKKINHLLIQRDNIA